jgi:hypothetical protein
MLETTEVVVPNLSNRSSFINPSLNFISTWGGRVSDRHMTLNSAFLDLIDPGDQIMADRGFLVKEEIMIKRGTLIIPPPAQGVLCFL